MGVVDLEIGTEMVFDVIIGINKVTHRDGAEGWEQRLGYVDIARRRACRGDREVGSRQTNKNWEVWP